MGRFGSRNIDSDAAAIFFEEAYAARSLRTGDPNATWEFFFDEWSRLAPDQQDAQGVEHLLGVIELWLWDAERDAVAATHTDHVAEAIAEHGPRIDGKHPGFLHTRALFALAQLARQRPTPRTRRRAGELIDWSRDAIRRLGYFGGPGGKSGRAVARSLRRLRGALG